MISTGYGAVAAIALVLAGLWVFVKRKDQNHYFLFTAIALYWVLGGFAQDILKSNSIPMVDGFLALGVGYAAIFTARKTKTYWPWWIACFMLFNVINDVWYIINQEAYSATRETRFLYQSITFLLYYLSLLTVCFHRTRVTDDNTQSSYVYS